MNMPQLAFPKSVPARIVRRRIRHTRFAAIQKGISDLHEDLRLEHDMWVEIEYDYGAPDWDDWFEFEHDREQEAQPSVYDDYYNSDYYYDPDPSYWYR